MSNVTTTFLENFGLNKNDTKVYLDVYQHDHSFASSISARTGIDRTTTYSIIRKLIKLGLINQTKVRDVSAYTALPAEVFLNKLDIEIEELEARKRATNTFIDQLKKIRKHSYARPMVKIFEGPESIKNLYEQTLIPNSQQKAFLTIETIPEELNQFLKDIFVRDKIRKRVSSKVIIQDSKSARHYHSLDQKSNRESRLIKDPAFDIASEVILFGDHKVAIIDFNKKPFGLLIESKTFRRTFETLFDHIWKDTSGTTF